MPDGWSGGRAGKVGPFVHIGTMVAWQLMRLPFFARIASSPAMRRQVLASAAYVGAVAGLFCAWLCRD